jgi:lysozyme family protein
VIENREIWLETLFKLEGGYVNDPNDSGGATNMGITIKTLSDWRGEECNIEDVTGLTEQEAKDIYLSRYWQVMRGDQLPSGLDLYACDFAVNSGPGRAARVLQELVGTEVDSFVGPKTIAAIRAKDPQQLLLDYDAARMDFLMDLPKWEIYGRGWTNRCKKMLAVARSRLQARPAAAEAAGSKIIKANAPTAVASAGGLAWAIAEYGPVLLDWLRNPDNVAKLQSGVDYVQTAGSMPSVVLVLGGLLTLATGVNAASVWWRYRMWRKGEV